MIKIKSYSKNDVYFSVEEHDGESIVLKQHLHSHYEFYYLCSGEIEYFVDNTIYTLKKGDLVVIPPNTLHNSIVIQNPVRKRILINLNKEFMQNEKEIKWPGVGIFHLKDGERIKDLITELSNEQKTGNSVLMMKALMCEFLILLSRRENKNDGYLIQNNPSSELIMKIVDFINKEYFGEITLKTIANMFYVNESYLSRCFKQNTGFNFSEYLNKYRVKKAVELLEETDKNITKVALSVGFNSSNHFCKIFKKIMGCSPLQYKRGKQAIS